MNKKLVLITAALLHFYIPKATSAYDDMKTHPDLTKAAILKSKLDNYN